MREKLDDRHLSRDVARNVRLQQVHEYQDELQRAMDALPDTEEAEDEWLDLYDRQLEERPPQAERLAIDLMPSRLREIAERLRGECRWKEAGDLLATASALAKLVNRHVEVDADKLKDPVKRSPDYQFEPPVGRWFVYVGRAARDVVLYVGMTGVLFERLGTWQQAASRDNPNTNWMKHAVRVDVYECASRKEALALETKMIKAFDPPYNVAQAEGPKAVRRSHRGRNIKAS